MKFAAGISKIKELKFIVRDKTFRNRTISYQISRFKILFSE